MIIREFSERDIDDITSLMKQICQIKGQTFNESRWRTSLEKRMKEEHSEVMVAFDKNNNEILGMAQCSIRNTDQGQQFGYISNLIVKEEKRRIGIGEMLMHHIIDFFRKNRINSIRLALKTNNDEAAITLFLKLGFQELFSIYELKI